MDQIINLFTVTVYLIPSLLILCALIILIRVNSHFSVILMIISVLGKILTDSIELFITGARIISFNMDYIISFLKMIQSFSLLYNYTFAISFLIFIFRYKSQKKQSLNKAAKF
ncbi:hypothetical protein DRF59_08905 [Chryseobacterium flavum]|uniref:Uncharacterized protein n=1 Tax=Chryseobacterium flavum TaxID=415851 RepID=A0A3D9CMV3_9FLAO|nr:hypothetical protein DRF59_08905 [Chryseobacterium flavum]